MNDVERADLADLALVCHRETDRAFLLSRGSDDPRWAAKRHVERGVGPMADVYTMPKWVARERGWL